MKKVIMPCVMKWWIATINGLTCLTYLYSLNPPHLLKSEGEGISDIDIISNITLNEVFKIEEMRLTITQSLLSL